MRIRSALLSGSMIIIAAVVAQAKCALMIVTIQGEVARPLNATQKISAEVAPASKWDFSTDVDHTHFMVTVRFDPTGKRPWWRLVGEEGCNRNPTFITITLVEGEHQLDTVRLDFPKDFAQDKPGYYSARKNVRLGSKLSSHTPYAPPRD